MAYQKHILFLDVSLAKKKKIQKEVMVVKVTLEYPPREESMHYKRGQPHPRYQVKIKRASCIQCNKFQEETIKEIISEWKNQMQKVLGKYVYV
jgi:hypothetical protein